MAEVPAWKIRSFLWDELRGLRTLLEPRASRTQPPGEDPLTGSPKRPGAGRQWKPVAAERWAGFSGEMGIIPKILQRDGLSQLWIDIVEEMPISAVPPQIRRSLYNTLSHRVGLYPMNDKWYPLAANANTRLDLRWSVAKPPVAVAGNTPRGVSMSPRAQFRKAWKVPRYSTNPDVVVPTSRQPGQGGFAP